jgi:hypothetical protein
MAATSTTLIGAFKGLIHAMTVHDDPGQPPEIAGRWSACVVRNAAISQRLEDLAPSSPTYDPVITALNDATHAVDAADYTNAGSVNAALNRVESAQALMGALVGA